MSSAIRDQPQVFPTGDEIRLGPECVVWVTMDALAAYFQIDVAESTMNKTTFLPNMVRYYFCNTVMGNRLFSDSWLKARNEVIKGLPGVFQLVDDLLIGGCHYEQLVEMVGALLEVLEGGHDPGQQQGASGPEGLILWIHHRREHAVCRPKEGGGYYKLSARAAWLDGPLSSAQPICAGPGGGGQVEFRKLFKKDTHYVVTEHMIKEF